jgi:Lon-like protease
MLEPEWKQPDPPDARPVKARNPWTIFIVVGVVLLLLAIAFLVPIPIFWRLVPGSVEDVEGLVQIDGATDYASSGALYFTTVRVDQDVTFSEWVGTAFDDKSVVVLEEDFTGGGSEEDVARQAREDMRASKRGARDVAFTALSLLEPGARVKRVLPDSPAEGRLKVGDVILSVAGTPVYTSCETGAVIRSQSVGKAIEIELLRDGKEMTVSATPEALDERYPDLPLVGIEMNDKQPDESLPEVTIDTGDVGGPSAGLMFALAIYDRLTPDDLTKGRDIAGTGAISCDGAVAPIGGITQKIAAAEDQGAEIFLAPEANFEEAQAAADDIDVVSVGTFDDAVRYLSGLS